jgi:hypothetical protein
MIYLNSISYYNLEWSKDGHPIGKLVGGGGDLAIMYLLLYSNDGKLSCHYKKKKQIKALILSQMALLLYT